MKRVDSDVARTSGALWRTDRGRGWRLGQAVQYVNWRLLNVPGIPLGTQPSPKLHITCPRLLTVEGQSTDSQ